jgi:phi LC3 family holin
MNINWRVRAKNPTFWVGLIGAIGAPILAYLGLTAADLTTWESVGGVARTAIANPYLLGMVAFSVLSFLGIVTDPTTKGLGDSARALGYDEPHDGTEGEDADVS